MDRPASQRLRSADLVIVTVGGTIGTAARALLTPPHEPGALPLATLLINLVGSGLLGLLVERLARRPGRRSQTVGLLLGTGALGGFTTYSALAVDCVRLLQAGAVGTTAAYGLGTLLLGAVATWLGIILGRSRR